MIHLQGRLAPARELVLTGMRLRDWLTLVGQSRSRDWPRVARLTLQSTLNELMAGEEQRQLGAQIESQQPQPPLFVLGCWRSGTTWLHRLLCQDRRLAYPTTLQVLNPHTFFFLEGRLAGWPARLGNRLYRHWARFHWGTQATSWSRPSDPMPAGPTQPGEDEYALLMVNRSDLLAHLMAEPMASHYRRFLNLNSLTPEERRQWSWHWLHFLKKLTLRHGPRPLVLKSPNHTARVSTLLEIFPGARFLHIHRHPAQVYASFTRHLGHIARLGDRLHSGHTDPAQTCLNLYDQLYSAYLADRPRIPPGQLYELAFQDLERDPLGCLEEAYQSLGLPSYSAVRPQMQSFVEQHKDYQKNPQAALDPATLDRLHTRWGRYFEAFGYP